MAVDFNKATFGKKNEDAATTKADRPKAQFWLNIGYSVTVPMEDNKTEDRFIALPVGIPLDVNDKIATPNGRNKEFAATVAARNDLLDQILAVAEKLEAGEERTLNLTVQLRRVLGEAVAVKNEDNPFVKKLDL